MKIPWLKSIFFLFLFFYFDAITYGQYAKDSMQNVQTTEFLSSHSLKIYEFTDPDPLADKLVRTAPLEFIQGAFRTGQTVPEDESNQNLTDGIGAVATVSANQGILIFFPTLPVEPGGVIVRVSVRADGPGAQFALAALDVDQANGLESLDGSIATRIPATTKDLQDGWRQMVLFIESYKDAIVPVIQVVSVSNEQQTVWIDRLEILTPGDLISGLAKETTDIAVTGLDITEETHWPGDEIAIRITIANLGDTLAEGFLGRLYVDGIELGQQILEPLESGGQVVLDARWIPADPGDHLLRVDVEATRSVIDPDQGNNSLQQIVSVSSEPKPLADLLVNQVDIYFESRTSTQIQAEIANIGNATAENILTSFLFPDGSEHIVSILKISPNEVAIAQLTLSIAIADTFPLQVTVDPGNSIEEISEINNEYYKLKPPYELVENPEDVSDIPGPIRRMSKFVEEHGYDEEEWRGNVFAEALAQKMQFQAPKYAAYDPGPPDSNDGFRASVHSSDGVRLSVSPGSDPGAPSIFKNVGPFVNVEAAGTFHNASLSIGLTPDDASDVDPTAIRLFHYHSASQSYQLIQPSGLGSDGTYIWGLIQETGLFTAFALPRDQAKRALLHGMREIQPVSDMYKEIAKTDEPFLENEMIQMILNPNRAEIADVIQNPVELNRLGYQDLIGNAQLLEGNIFGEIPRDEKGHPIDARPILVQPKVIRPTGDRVITNPDIDPIIVDPDIDPIIIDPGENPIIIDPDLSRIKLPGSRESDNWKVPSLQVSNDYLPEYQLIDEIKAVVGNGAHVQIDTSPGGDWQSMGPTNLGGRVKSLAILPSSSWAIYAGVAEGGFFRIIGNWWFPTTDEMPSLSVGAIAVAPSDPKVIYVGTGEYWSTKMGVPATTYSGVGVYRSDDNGWNWELMPVNNNLSTRISRIVVHPDYSSILYVSGNKGVHRWNPMTQTWIRLTSTDTTDMVMHPTNPNVLYVGMEDLQGVQKISNAGSNSPTFTPMNNGLILTNHLPHFIKLAIAPSNSNILYAHINRETYDQANQKWVAINTRTYRHNGTQWSLIGTDVAAHSQSSWCSFVRVHPTNHNRVFVGGVKLAWTPDAGGTWYQLNAGHADCHDLIFDPLNPNRTILANDGGIWQHTQTANETTWTYSDFNHGNTSIQFYNVGVSQSGPFTLGGSTQDQGILYTHSSTNYDGLWGNEGGIFEVDPNNGNIIYWDPWAGNLRKTESGSSAGWHEITAGIEEVNGKKPSASALVVHPQDSDLLLCSAAAPGGKYAIYRSVDGGDIWEKVHSDVGSAVTRFAWAPSDPFWVYAVTRDGLVYRSTGLGTIWFLISNNTLQANRLYGLCVDWYDKQKVYIAGWQKSTKAVAWKSTDGGQNWEDISGPTNQNIRLPYSLGKAIVTHKGIPNTLYVCTEAGVFRSKNAGIWWIPFDKGLPNAVVTDMDYQPHSQTLFVSTIGRGMFKTLLY